MPVWLLIFLCIITALISGCYTPDASRHSQYQQQYQQSKNVDPLTAALEMVEKCKPQDKVMWEYRAAAIAMRYGKFEKAKQLLDDAILTINAMMSPNQEARKARGLFGKEEKKIFIGEPYERAMAYFYRGILYWMDGEPDNARACFKSAQLMDSDTENKTYANDYVLFDYLDGYITAKLGGDGSDSLKRARENAKSTTIPDYDLQANVFIFVEFGPGPTKYATGEYNEQLRFRTYKSPIQSATIKIADKTIHLKPIDDLNYQATTRGGRVMDHILANKAVFKDATDKVGTAAIVTGAILATSRDTRDAGLITAGIGLLGKVISSATVPAADTRDWNNLPQYLSFTALKLPPGQYTMTVEFNGESNLPDSRFTKQISFNVKQPPQDTVVFISDQSITPLNL